MWRCVVTVYISCCNHVVIIVIIVVVVVVVDLQRCSVTWYRPVAPPGPSTRHTRQSTIWNGVIAVITVSQTIKEHTGGKHSTGETDRSKGERRRPAASGRVGPGRAGPCRAGGLWLIVEKRGVTSRRHRVVSTSHRHWRHSTSLNAVQSSWIKPSPLTVHR